ncbi:MAG: ATP-binding protein, partial [Kiritimatiellae bacterium]|nr:ATP-binding protein [Kiritimatiellia bacterium]
MFFGREDLLEQLSSLWNKRVSSLVTCRGRRRIGKSTLIEQFASRSKARFLKIEGVRPERKTTSHDELAAFAKQLSDQCGCERTPP